MSLKKYFLMIGMLSLFQWGFSQKSILIRNVIIHHGNGDVTTSGAVGVDKQGRIDYVGTTMRASSASYDTLIDGLGKHLYPGLIAPNSTIGLQEIGAVRASRDQREIGTFTPNVRALIAYNTDSDILPTATHNGVLSAQITPRGGFIAGSSSVVSLYDRNWEEAAIAADEGIHLYWPSRQHKQGWWANPGGWKNNKNYTKQRKEISDYLEKALAYASHNEKDIRLASMQGIFTGDQRLYVHVNDAYSILEVLQLKKDLGIPKVVLVGAYHAHKVKSEIKKAGVPVLLCRTHSLPQSDDEPIDHPFVLAKILKDAGILVGLQNAGDMEQMNTRNMAFYAGTLTAFGMNEEEALQLVTLNNARILGVDADLGSIEKGKMATLFVSDGPALEMRKQQLTLGMIRGRIIDPMENRQLRLYKKYKAFYEEKP